MTSLTIGTLVFASVLASSLLAMWVRTMLPSHHLDSESKDTVKLAMGLIATTAALVLGLLIASAKGSYDTGKSEVCTMAAKIAFLDRVLAIYGPETAPARKSLHHAVEGMIARLWPGNTPHPVQLDSRASSAEELFHQLVNLSPQNEEQRGLKAQALATAGDLGQMRWLLYEHSGTSIPMLVLIIVVCWLAILFFSFGLFAPANGTAIAALIVAALSVAAATFLILELDQPFGGTIQVPRQPMINTLNHLGT